MNNVQSVQDGKISVNQAIKMLPHNGEDTLVKFRFADGGEALFLRDGIIRIIRSMGAELFDGQLVTFHGNEKIVLVSAKENDSIKNKMSVQGTDENKQELTDDGGSVIEPVIEDDSKTQLPLLQPLNPQNLTSDKRLLSEVRPISQKNGVVSPAGQKLIDTAVELINNAKTKNTVKAYSSDWNQFVEFCEQNNLSPAPATPETVILYIAQMVNEGKAYATIRRRVVSIRVSHEKANVSNPVDHNVKAAIDGAKKKLGANQIGKSPLLLEHIIQIVNKMDLTDIRDLRDRALILIGFAGFLRRSELVSIQYKDMKFYEEGVIINFADSKTGEMVKAIAYGKYDKTCPVNAVIDWCRVANIYEKYVFRNIDQHGNIGENLSDRAVADIIKKHVLSIGLQTIDYSGHSLRAGGATEGYRVTNDVAAVMRQGNWKSDVVYRYIREQRIFENNISANLGL